MYKIFFKIKNVIFKYLKRETHFELSVKKKKKQEMK